MQVGSESSAGDDRASSCPWWAQALDVVGAALVVTAVAWLARGGPRITSGSLSVLVQSPLRVLAWAAGVITLRHLLLRRPALPARLFAGVRTLARAGSLRAALAPFVASRTAVLLAAYLALVTIGYSTESPRPTFSDNQFLNLVTKWDGEWYLNIAIDGYHWDDAPRVTGTLPPVVSRPQARLAFFPAYPMLMRAAGWIVGDTIAGGLVVSLAAFLWALAYVFRLARDEIGDADAAGAVLLLAFYPFSTFYGVIYTESLFLLAAAGGLYHFRRAEWGRASLWGLVIGLTRPNGFLLSVVLAAAGFERVIRQRRAGSFDAREWRRVRAGALAASMPVVGVLIYSAFCWSLSGDPVMWMRLHRLWGRGGQTLAQLVAGQFGEIARLGLVGYLNAMPFDVVNSCAAIFALAAIWPVFRRLGLACGVFIAINVIPPLWSGTTVSVARLTSTLFPLFIWLAAAVRGDRRVSLIGLFAILQGLFAVLFFTWRWFY
jgi:hypothetical protein